MVRIRMPASVTARIPKWPYQNEWMRVARIWPNESPVSVCRYPVTARKHEKTGGLSGSHICLKIAIYGKKSMVGCIDMPKIEAGRKCTFKKCLSIFSWYFTMYQFILQPPA